MRAASGGRRCQRIASRSVVKRILGLTGSVLLIAGVVFAIRPIRALGADCGSVIKPAGGITPMECDKQLNDRGRLALALGLGGLAAVITSLGVASLSGRRTKS
jgi:hypothetical protein